MLSEGKCGNRLCELLSLQAIGAILVAIACLTIPGMIQTAQAQTYSVLYSLQGQADGCNASSTLFLDSAGNLYGTTRNGGTNRDGTVFKLDSAGILTVLHSFNGHDGYQPFSGVIRDNQGNLYGTTEKGGAFSGGTVFKLSPSGKLTVLHSFGQAGTADGYYPAAGVIRDAAGNLFGTTSLGGTLGGGLGAVFKLDPTGNETVLHSFAGADGATPYAGLIRDSSGNLYGTTVGGGASCGLDCFGTVFKLELRGVETVVYSFENTPDGESPQGNLIRDNEGNLYSTTAFGGTAGQGTVFKIDSAGGESVLYSFSGGLDGGAPIGGLVRDSGGNLYGVASTSEKGTGVVFKLDRSGKETVLHSFTGGTDGKTPFAGLAQDAAGNLYGTTLYGGNRNCGVVFKVTP